MESDGGRGGGGLEFCINVEPFGRSRWVKFSTFASEQARSIAVELALLSPRAASSYGARCKNLHVLLERRGWPVVNR